MKEDKNGEVEVDAHSAGAAGMPGVEAADGNAGGAAGGGGGAAAHTVVPGAGGVVGAAAEIGGRTAGAGNITRLKFPGCRA